jgi:hypothetical protein
MAARSAVRFDASLDLVSGFRGFRSTGLFSFAPKSQTPAAKPMPSAMQAQSKLTTTKVPIAAGKKFMNGIVGGGAAGAQ